MVWAGGEGVLGEGAPALVFNYSTDVLRQGIPDHQTLPTSGAPHFHQGWGGTSEGSKPIRALDSAAALGAVGISTAEALLPAEGTAGGATYLGTIAAARPAALAVVGTMWVEKRMRAVRARVSTLTATKRVMMAIEAHNCSNNVE